MQSSTDSESEDYIGLAITASGEIKPKMSEKPPSAPVKAEASTKVVVKREPNVLDKMDIMEKCVTFLKRSTNKKETIEVFSNVLNALLTKSESKRLTITNAVGTFVDEINACATIDEIHNLVTKFENKCCIKELKEFIIDRSLLRGDPFPFGLIGQGSYSHILRSKLVKDNKMVTVAIKVPSDTRFIPMVISEAKLLAKLKHPNIIRILGFVPEEDNQFPIVVLEHMSHGNLMHALKEVQFSVHNLLNIINDVVDALIYMTDEHHILHLDIALRNVLINGKKQTKLADFGSAKYVGDTNGVYETKTQQYISSVSSPESMKSLIFRKESDVWSLGVFILDLFHTHQHNGMEAPNLFGVPLFNAAFRQMVLNNELPPLKKCPKLLFEFVTKHCLNKNYKDRPDYHAIKEKIEECVGKK